MANGRSLSRADLDALADGTRIVVTLSGRAGARQTVAGELRRGESSLAASDEPTLFVDGYLVAVLNPGDGFDEDFVVQAEGGQA